LFKSLGLAVEDLTAARMVLTAYQQRKQMVGCIQAIT
jgi:ornithine cyclodeaminase/alanine dehydrogenase-like protein (mu-crystallin family)